MPDGLSVSRYARLLATDLWQWQIKPVGVAKLQPLYQSLLLQSIINLQHASGTKNVARFRQAFVIKQSSCSSRRENCLPQATTHGLATTWGMGHAERGRGMWQGRSEKQKARRQFQYSGNGNGNRTPAGTSMDTRSTARTQQRHLLGQ